MGPAPPGRGVAVSGNHFSLFFMLFGLLGLVLADFGARFFRAFAARNSAIKERMGPRGNSLRRSGGTAGLDETRILG